MAVVTTTSTYIGNRDATPVVLTDPAISGGQARESMGYASIVSGNSVNSLFPLCNVPSNARIVAVSLQNDAIGTSATCSVGVYKNYKDAGNVYGTVAVSGSDTLFASGYSIASAAGSTNITNQAGNFEPNLQEEPLWQALGLTADPVSTYDIYVKLTGAAATSTGYVALRVSFIV